MCHVCWDCYITPLPQCMSLEYTLLTIVKLIYLNFQPLEVVSRYRDPQVVKITNIC